MKSRTPGSVVLRASIAVALALAIWSTVQARSAESEAAKEMSEAKMMEHCKEMKEHKAKMAEAIKAEDAALTEQIAKMNAAPDDKKMGLMAAVVTRMAEQSAARDAHKAKMDDEMMKHMMEHMHQGGKDCMEHCPMMKGMKDKD